MKFIYFEDFYKMVNGYSEQLVIDIVQAHHLLFFTMIIPNKEDDADFENACIEECIKFGWDINNTTIIYNFNNTKYNKTITCGAINRDLKDLVTIFNKTKKLKAFL